MLNRILRVACLLVVSWVVLTTTHELGHLLAGWCCGGTLQSADLLPWHLPYSIFDPDPRPLMTVWGGPLLGVAIPLGLGVLMRRDGMWFVAYFCVLANGAYIATAWYSGDRYLDTTRLIEHGAGPVSIGLYCVVTLGLGYCGFRRTCLRLFKSP